MKHTIFTFRIQLSSEQPSEVLRRVLAKVQAIRGVDEIKGDVTESSADLRVQVSFSTSDGAKKLHRKVMTALIRMDNVTVTQASSTLTDVFE